MKIVTGVGENAHVTPEEFRMIFEGTFGNNAYILDTGERMAPELVSNNLLKIKSGLMCDDEGNISSVDVYDEVELKNGTQGMKRIDLIVNRYTKNDETKIEKNEWICITGTPAASNPVVPAHITGSLRAGDLVKDIPFIKVHFDGLNITEVKRLLEVSPLIPKIANNLSNPNLLINGDFQVNQRGATKYTNTNGWSPTYTVDRWQIRAGTGYELSVETNDDGTITVTNKNPLQEVHFRQHLENTLIGNNYTLSAEVVSVSGNVYMHTDDYNGSAETYTLLENGVNEYHTNNDVSFVGFRMDINSSITLKWVKLEQGNVATPFVPRLYAEELALCQRYYQQYTFGAKTPIGHGVFVDKKYLCISLPLTTSMRVTPTFAINKYVAAEVYTQGTQETFHSYWVHAYSIYGNYVVLQGCITNEIAMKGLPTTLMSYDGDTRIISFDAEIY